MKFSTCTICVSGLNLGKVAFQLQSIGVCVLRARFDKNYLTITVRDADRRKTLAYFADKCYTIHWCKRGGLATIATFVTRLGLVIACAVLVIVTCICSRFCLLIDVQYEGNNRDIDKQVRQVLSSAGVVPPCSIGTLNIAAIERLLYNSIDCSYVFVSVSGSVLSIEVHDLLVAPTPIDFSTPRDIVSPVSGTVERIVYISGTCCVKVGDRVQEGQTLISGAVTFADGTTAPIRAQGYVYVRTESSYAVQFVPEVIRTRKTGAEQVITRLSIGKRTMQTKPIAFEQYSVLSESVSLYPLNIVVEHWRVSQLEEYIETISYDSALENMRTLSYNGVRELVEFEIDTIRYIEDGEQVICIASGIVCAS